MSTSYDAVPYRSFPYAQTHIAHLHTLGRLFRIDPPAFRRARVLELGCASGGNLLPMASEYPEARFVGIDLSQVQIEEAQRHAQALDLTNITFEARSILDIGPSFGTFDYIICHGVFSWVPVEVQQKILAVIKAHLAPTGIAFVSYNTLPGWNQVRSVRDMLLYHCNLFPEPAAKVAQARALLEFIRDAQGPGGVYRGVVENELNVLATTNETYFLHDHMEENNFQYYFHEFMAMASSHGLDYLSDSHLNTMYMENYGEKVVSTLNALSNDIVRLEQYFDFITNRRFRNTLLCHSQVKINRNLDAGQLDEFFLRSLIRVADADAGPMAPGPRVFKGPGSVEFSTSDRPTILALLALQDLSARPARTADVVNAVRTGFGFDDGPAIRAALINNALRLVLAGAMVLYSDPGRTVATPGKRPLALPLARYQALRGPDVTNGRHESLTLNPVWHRLLPSLDGSRTIKDLVALILEGVAKGEFSVTKAGGASASSEEAAALVEETVKTALAELAQNGLLIG